LFFTNNLAAGAYGSPAYYTVTNLDGVAVSPAVGAVFAIAGSTNGVELALRQELVPGALYRVTALGVPAVDLTVTGADAQHDFRPPSPPSTATTETPAHDVELALYGRDLIHDGDDYLETADGDLAVISGTANAEGAVRRRLLGSPLPWAPQYSPNAREFVDSVDAKPLRGRLRAQALRDPRVKAAEATYDDSTSVFRVTVTLIGGHSPDPFPVAVRT
jgi:hypothetical protein